MAVSLRYNLLSLFARPTSTISSIVLVAVVIAAFAYLQAVTDSAFSTMAGTGDAKTVIVLSQSADSETVSSLGKDDINKLEMAPAAERKGSAPLISTELVAISSAFMHDGTEVAVNTAVRGVDFDAATAVRRGRVKIVEGRPFQAGTFEAIVGDAARKLYRGHEIGDEVQLGTRGLRKFKIAGVFSTGGTAADSEIWGYAETLRDVYGRSTYSSARLIVPHEQAGRELIEFVQGTSVGLTAKTERDYFRGLNTNERTTQVLSVAMIIIMGIAATFAVANTMFAAVAGRTREIGMLRALGFGRVSILTGFVFEGLLLTFMGGALGCVLSLACNGLRRNMLPATFTTVTYTLEITPKIVGTSLTVALAIGLLGSIMPAWRAAKLNVITALREA